MSRGSLPTLDRRIPAGVASYRCLNSGAVADRASPRFLSPGPFGMLATKYVLTDRGDDVSRAVIRPSSTCLSPGEPRWGGRLAVPQRSSLDEPPLAPHGPAPIKMLDAGVGVNYAPTRNATASQPVVPILFEMNHH